MAKIERVSGKHTVIFGSKNFEICSEFLGTRDNTRVPLLIWFRDLSGVLATLLKNRGGDDMRMYMEELGVD